VRASKLLIRAAFILPRLDRLGCSPDVVRIFLVYPMKILESSLYGEQQSLNAIIQQFLQGL